MYVCIKRQGSKRAMSGVNRFKGKNRNKKNRMDVESLFI